MLAKGGSGFIASHILDTLCNNEYIHIDVQTSYTFNSDLDSKLS